MGKIYKIKTVVVLGDGMADYPVPELGGKTPLMAAAKPSMDRIAKYGRTGLFRAIGPGKPTGSAVANLSVLGYDPDSDYRGRGVLEAASLGLAVNDTDMVFRVNLINISDGQIASHSSGHISNEEAGMLIRDLAGPIGKIGIRLHQGLSYRHIGILPGGDDRLICTEPHDHIGERALDRMVKPGHPDAKPTADLLNRMILESQTVLKNHPVNLRRAAFGKPKANSLWPWSPGGKPSMRSFESKFGVKGAVICAVDLIKGIAMYAGMDVVSVDGATGLYDTNYEGKADACLEALRTHDFVYVHVEAADEAGHDRNLGLKIRCIEDLDNRCIRRILDGLKSRDMEAVVAVLPDHPTPVTLGAHVRDPVPVAVWDPRVPPDDVDRYDENSVKAGALGLMEGTAFIETVLGIGRFKVGGNP
jgi:2,3-bisphosphoglycerate-independent phosphoglycerate mutase